jgi:hypothetical protein
MMNNNRSAHLDVQRIIASLVDENDLAEQEKEHLKVCPICSASRHHLAAQLDGLSEEAIRWTPEPRRRVTLGEAEVLRGRGWAGRWYVGLATAAACLVLIITLTVPHLFTGNLQPYGKLNLAAEMEADEMFIATTEDIEENCLPASLREILPDTGSTDDNDDFLDFVAPVEA